MSNNLERDKDLTKNKLLTAVGSIIETEGFDKLGINNIAQKAGVSKVLIYRYFESLDNLILEYFSLINFWENFSIEFPKNDDYKEYLKKLFHNQIDQLKTNNLLKSIQKWELTNHNLIIEKLRLKREAKSATTIAIMEQLVKSNKSEVATFVSIISSSITYLCLFEDSCPIYNGIDLNRESGWDKIKLCIDILIDKMF